MAMFKFNLNNDNELNNEEASEASETAALAPVEYEQALPAAPTNSHLQHDVVIHGDIEAVNDLVIFSMVKGSVTCQGDVQIQDAVIEGGVTARSLNMHGGSVSGDLNIRDTVMIDGTVTGNIRCEEVLLQCNAKVTGNIRCSRFCAAFGAAIEGKLNVTGAPASPKEDEPAAGAEETAE